MMAKLIAAMIKKATLIAYCAAGAVEKTGFATSTTIRGRSKNVEW